MAVARINQLTGLRFFAAMLVFFSHLPLGSPGGLYQTLFVHGYVGVSFFFVLSGFVLSYSYAEKLQNGSLSKFKYMLLRYARIMPLHLLVTIPFVVGHLVKKNFEPVKSLLNLTLLHSWVPSSAYYFSLNSPSWSLSNEIFFYFSFIGLIFMTAKNKIQILCALLAIIILSAGITVYKLQGTHLMEPDTFSYWMFYVFPLFRLLEFVVGMVIFDFWKQGAFSSVKSDGLIFPALFIAMYFGDIAPMPFRMSLFYLPFVALLLISHLSQQKSFFVSLFSSRLLVLLGEASFAFYIIHTPIIDIVTKFFPSIIKNDLLYFLIVFTTATLISIIVYLYIEKPIERKLKSIVIGRSS